MNFSINHLETRHYYGVDASLETSLFEYGLAIQEEKNHYNIIYGVSIDDNGNYNKFDSYNEYTDKDFNDLITESWFDLKAVLNFVGMTKEDWIKLPLVSKIDDCLSYYGYENCFGSSYYPFVIS